MLTKLKLLLGITTTDKDSLLELLIEDAQVLVESYVQDYLVLDEPLLQLIVIEIAVERFNKLGAEGMSSQDIEGYKRVYDSSSLESYTSKLDLFLVGKKPKSPRGKRFRSL